MKSRKDKESHDKKEQAMNQEPEENEANEQETDAADNEAAADSEKNELEEVKAQLEASQQKVEEYLNMAQRVQADFDNFRRRNQAVRAESFEDGAREFIKTLLPVVDNLERALSVETTDKAMHDGVEMVLRQMYTVLEKRGVSTIDRLNEKFDPNLENAVLQGTEDEGEKGCVCAVLQKGYKMGDFVLRHAMVKVVPE